MDHKGTVRLQTQRLILRRFAPEDAAAMYANWASDPEVTRYLTWPPHSSAELTGKLLALWIPQYDEPDHYNWAMELRETGELIGNISVVRVIEPIAEAEMGWCMGQRWWGKGYMPEAARAVFRFLFDEVGFNRITAAHDVENPKSGRVMQKVGMRFEGIRRQGGRNNRGIIDDAVYAILRSDERGNA